MNTFQRAQQAYGAAENAVRSDRSLEHAALAKASRDLKAAHDAEPFTFSALAEALHANSRLWTLLAVNVADPENQLSPDIRARIFYLAEFTLHHTRAVLEGTGSIDPLLDVNTTVMRGLRSTQEAA
ncbi:flagellar biosynthesis regulator FlaF [Aestuariibius sp. 2305UL40-4]|uniref:flagellar biosynthesis regulator FlaF n=1 Tax=Aestuariibius violaceus TaxID=3234132 RepID=UPI00345EB2F9